MDRKVRAHGHQYRSGYRRKISLKLAALGKPEDRGHSKLCAAAGVYIREWERKGSGCRLSFWSNGESAVAIQSTYDLLSEFYDSPEQDRGNPA